MKKALLAFLLSTFMPYGCAAALPAAETGCKIVSVLNGACMLLTFVGADGKPHTVTCTAKELNDWGRVVEARHISTR